MIKRDSQPDWEVDESRKVPKTHQIKDCHTLYVNFHPGIYHLIMNDIQFYMKEIYDIELGNGRVDNFGDATTKKMFYFRFPADGEERELLVTLYPTKTALDVKITGSPQASARKFKDKGNKNGANFFVFDIVAKMLNEKYDDSQKEKAKTHWINLAREGLKFEETREKGKGKGTKKKKRRVL